MTSFMYTPFPEHSVFHVEEVKSIDVCGATIFEVKGSSFTLPRDFNRKYDAEHNIYTCENCGKQYKNVLQRLERKLNKFPKCCDYHKNLLQAKWFRKSDFKEAARFAAEKIFFSWSFIQSQLDKPDWAIEIHDYIYHIAHTFGSFPKGYGSALFIGEYFDCLTHMIATSNLPSIVAKKDLLLQLLIDVIEKDKYIKDEERDFGVLLETYNKWFKAFPFDFYIFSNLKSHFTKHIPIFETTRYNKYLELSLSTTTSKTKLISNLKEITESILLAVNGAYLYEQGKLDDINQYKLNLIIQKRKFNLKSGYTSNKNDIKEIFNDTLKNWLDEEIDFINEITPLLKETEKTDLKDNLFKSVLSACYKLQESKIYWDNDENGRTKCILDFINFVPYITKDQPHYGISSTGIKPGSVDGVIIDRNNVEYFIEALNLDSIDRTSILSHINKLEDNYDSKGLKNKYIIAYCNIEDDSFNSFFERYYNFIQNDCRFRFKLQHMENIQNDYTNQRVIKTIHHREGEEVNLYHILLKMPIK